MKRIFYYTDVLPFLSKEETAINKLIYNLGVFRERAADVHLVWHPWSGTDKYLELNNSSVLSQYREIVKEFINDGWGEMDESSSFAEAKAVLLSCDAYYGDASDLVYEATIAGIPVMLQSFTVWSN